MQNLLTLWRPAFAASALEGWHSVGGLGYSTLAPVLN